MPERDRRPLLVAMLLFLAFAALDIPKVRASAPRPTWFVEKDGQTNGVPWQGIDYLSDRLHVKGFLFDAGQAGRRPAVVFNHGGVSGVSADVMRRSADLARAGYIVFAPTYRGEGGSEGVVEVAKGEVNDVLEAARILRGHARVDPHRIALVGSSHGALVSVLAASRDHDFAAVVSACGVLDVHSWYRYLVDNGFDVHDSLSVAVYGSGPDDRPAAFNERSAIRVAGKLTTPLLLQQGMKDRIVPHDQVYRMAGALQRAGKPAPRILTYPLLGHAFWFWDRDHHPEEEMRESDQSWSDLLAFLNEHLSPGEAPPAASVMPAGYEDELRAWQRHREDRLKADDGWLTVAGLFWLEPGVNRMGSSDDNEIRLPGSSAPPRAGSFLLEGNRVSVEVLPGVRIESGGKAVERMTLHTDRDSTTDTLSIGSLRMFVIQRSKGYGIRLRDLASPARQWFQGIDRYPIEPTWRVEARWIPFDPPHPIEVPNILGSVDTAMAPGRAEFERDGREYSLVPILEEGDTDLFFIFKDATSGEETYPPGRFLYASPPADGRVILDFNRAYNPPCVFTPYATCPLPPEGNELPIAVRAGEKMYRDSEGHAIGHE